MEKLSKKKIQFVKQFKKDGLTYQYYVCMKPHTISDITYGNFDKKGNLKKEGDYAFENLPKCVQEFVKERYVCGNFFTREDYYRVSEDDYAIPHKFTIHTFE